MLTVVGVLADIFGLVSGVQGFLKGEVLLMVLAAIAILLITCSWLWRKRHKLALGLLAVGCLLAGASAAIGLQQLLALATYPPNNNIPLLIGCKWSACYICNIER